MNDIKHCPPKTEANIFNFIKKENIKGISIKIKRLQRETDRKNTRETKMKNTNKTQSTKNLNNFLKV